MDQIARGGEDLSGTRGSRKSEGFGRVAAERRAVSKRPQGKARLGFQA